MWISLFGWLTTFSTTHSWSFCLLFCPMALLGLDVVSWIFRAPFHYLFLSWNRWLRSRNIKAAGWPPPHLDVDGDFAKEKKS